MIGSLALKTCNQHRLHNGDGIRTQGICAAASMWRLKSRAKQSR